MPDGDPAARRPRGGSVASGRTTDRTCDRCGRSIDVDRWFPVAFDADRGAIRAFCSVECKRRFPDR